MILKLVLVKGCRQEIFPCSQVFDLGVRKLAGSLTCRCCALYPGRIGNQGNSLRIWTTKLSAAMSQVAAWGKCACRGCGLPASTSPDSARKCEIAKSEMGHGLTVLVKEEGRVAAGIYIYIYVCTRN